MAPAIHYWLFPFFFSGFTLNRQLELSKTGEPLSKEHCCQREANIGRRFLLFYFFSLNFVFIDQFNGLSNWLLLPRIASMLVKRRYQRMLLGLNVQA
jgi:hypothetical protein